MATHTFTFEHQATLPKLPIPSLEATCKKFLEWVKPLLSEAAFHETQQIVSTFQAPGSEGQRLQERLLQWAQAPNRPSWLAPFWDDMYLTHRDSVVLHLNPCHVYAPHPTTETMTQTERAALITHAALQFKHAIDAESLEPETVRGEPLCMALYQRMFSTTRIPQLGRDQLKSPAGGDIQASSTARHIIVIHRGQLYQLTVLSEEGAIATRASIQQQLDTIVSRASASHAWAPGVGMLTSLDRDTWARARETIRNLSDRNKQFFEIIEDALFCLCLDDTAPNTPEEKTINMLYGDGHNRWFDKAIQFIVCQNGVSGSNIEHTGFDGSNVARLIQAVYEAPLNTDSALRQDTKATLAPLALDLTADIATIIHDAEAQFRTHTQRLRIKTLCFKEFGKARIKSFQLSPDGFIQCALQLAQFTCFDRCFSTYEAVMMRRFLHGRTEAMRSVTEASMAFVKIMQTECDNNEKIAALKAATEQHTQRIKVCQTGEGIQRHLFGLLKIYQRDGQALGINQVPKFFEDTGWKTLCHDTFSTSTTNTPGLLYGGFGPVVEDGFGVRYNGNGEALVFTLTAWAQNETTLIQFTDALKTALIKMAALFTG